MLLYDILKIEAFCWDEGNLEHFFENEYDISPEEAEEVFVPENLFEIKRHEDKYFAFGKSYIGRYLCIVFEYKGNFKARPVTGWPMSRKEIRKYKNKGV